MKNLFKFGLAALLAIAVTIGAFLARGAYVDAHIGWERLTESAEFSPRDTAEGFQLNGHLWLSNGYFHGNKLTRDLWKSTDGREWDLVNEATPYDGYSQIEVMDGRAVAVFSSAWQSANGTDWERLSDIPLKTRMVGAAAKLGESIYYVDGDKVLKSSDGTSWEVLTERAPFWSRQAGTLVAHDNRLLYIAGATPREESGERRYNDLRSYSDVWSSSDGVKWTRILDRAPWSARMWPTVIVKDNRIWLFGGFSNEINANLGDLWVSDNGVDWLPVHLPGGPSPRHFATPYATDDGIIFAAGNAWPVQNDVWLLRTPAFMVDLDLRAIWLKVWR